MPVRRWAVTVTETERFGVPVRCKQGNVSFLTIADCFCKSGMWEKISNGDRKYFLLP